MRQSIRTAEGRRALRVLPLPGKLARQRRARNPIQPKGLPYLFIALPIAVVIITNLVPLVFTVVDSFRRVSELAPGQPFVGIHNYRAVMADPAFQSALVNTLSYAGLTAAGVLVFGMILALWLQRVRHARAWLLTIILLPWAVPGVIDGSIWSLIVSPADGALNGWLQRLDLVNHEILWLQSPSAIFVVTLTLLWQALPIGTLILLAGLGNIPTELYEQARVDGARFLRVFRSITLPLLRPVVAVTLAQAAISGLNIFDQIYVLNGDASSTVSVVQQTYNYVFTNLDFGLGYSAAFIFLIMSLIITLAILLFVYREVEL